MERTVLTKFRTLKNMTPVDTFIYWQDDPVVTAQIRQLEIEAAQFQAAIHKEENTRDYIDAENNLVVNTPTNMPRADLALNGLQNLHNSMAAGISASLLNIRKDVIKKALSDFEGVEHRLEPCGEVDGVKFINDSKATNVNSTWYALESMTAPTVLILGGEDKDNDYSEILDLVKQKVVGIVAMGEDNAKIIEYFKGVVPVADTHSLDEAISHSRKMAKPGHTILLSPCCSSCALFDNYEDQGRKFKEAVTKLSDK